MRFVVRLAPLLCLTAGCGFAQKPYADDPLLRGGRGVWMSDNVVGPAQTKPTTPAVIEAPQPPAIIISPRWE